MESPRRPFFVAILAVTMVSGIGLVFKEMTDDPTYPLSADPPHKQSQQALPDNDPRRHWPGPDKRATNKYFLTEFIPSYRREDCIVALRYHYSGPENLDADGLLFSQLSRFLFSQEPKAALFSSSTQNRADGPIKYIQYADQCERRFDITKAYARSVTDVFTGWFEIEVSEQNVLPGPETIDSRGNWIDDPDYDPEFWALYQRAFRGDPIALISLAQLKTEAEDWTSAYLAARLAEQQATREAVKAQSIRWQQKIETRLSPDEMHHIESQLQIYRDFFKETSRN